MTNAEEAGRLDVDTRFLLANERTLLAWVRTGLTMQAGGVALVQLVGRHRMLAVAGFVLVLLGAVAAGTGYRRYRRADQAIRAGVLPQPGRGPLLLTVGVAALGVGVVVGYAIAWLC